MIDHPSNAEPAPAVCVALVGHCGPDAFALRSAVRRFAPGAQIVAISGDAELDAALGDAGGPALVLLVNRVLDGDFENPSGIGVMRRAASARRRTAVMLISNLPEAQAEAVAVGAVPGFGKRDLNTDKARDALNRAVAQVTRT